MERLIIWLFHFLFFFFHYQSASSSPLSSSPSSNHSCPLNERSSLLQFKQMFTIDSSESFFPTWWCEYSGFPSYAKTLSWNETTDCCSWDGVTCNVSTGHVTGLDLSCSKLYGTIHPNTTLFQLSHLQQLNLAFNHFNFSPISPLFGRLTSLSHLNLSYSFLSGSIPSEIAHLSRLVSLDLSTSIVPSIESKSYVLEALLRLEPHKFKMLLKNLTQLQDLVLHQVNISSRLPDSLMNLSSLATIDLTWTGLLGDLPYEIFQLPKLQKLYLGYNHNMTGNLLKVKWGCNNSLEELDLSDNQFSGPPPESLGNLKRITKLYLSSNQFSGPFPESLGNLTRITELDLIINQFSGPLLESLGNLKKITKLYLTSNQFSGPFPESLGNLTRITELNLISNQFSGPFPESLGNLKKITKLYLSSNQFSRPFPKSLGNLTRITELDLLSNQFSGPLPESLGNLKRITKLYLSSNQFSGPLPEWLGNLTTITDLILWGSGFNGQGNNRNGEILDFLAKLLKLEYLSLRSSNFAGPFPSWVANLTQLENLDISDNALTGPIPSNITGFQKLSALHLSNNSLNGTLPSWLFTIPSLQELDLSSNQLTGQIPEFRRDSPLEYIYLSYNKLHGPIPQSIFGLVNLSYLSLQSNNLNGFVVLQKFSNLHYLDLSKNNITVSIGSNANATWPNLRSLRLSSCNITEFPIFLQNSAENLEALDLSNNKIHGEIPKWVEGASLYLLDLSHNYLQGPLLVPSPVTQSFLMSHNKLTGEIPSSICNLSSLYILVLSNNNLTGVIPQCLGNVSNDLSVLDLRMNGFHGAIPKTFARGSKYLRSLNLYGNHLQGSVPRSLANCRSLEVLDLGNNILNGAFPHWLESLPELQVLVLNSNRFHGPIGTSGTETPFPKLRIFDLSHNNFTGLLPQRYFLNFKAMMNVQKSKILSQYMGDSNYRDSVELVLKGVEIELEYILTIFTTIDFSCNNFRGEIPNGIGKLQGLRLLNLSQNSFSGHLPSLLGNITMLESLDLSSNRLIGEIPEELTSLTFLALLNLSKNHLVGPIPHGKQFDTFQNDSYLGNSGLCGLPLSKKCGDSEAQEQPKSRDDDEDDDFVSGFTWRIVLVGYGCGFVIGAIMGFVMFLIGRPRWYTRLVREEPRRKVVRINQIGWRRSH